MQQNWMKNIFQGYPVPKFKVAITQAKRKQKNK